MPVLVDGNVQNLSQAEFGEISYQVLRRVFDLRRTLGQLFDEDVYKLAIAQCMPDSRPEVQIDVSYGDFRKSYFMDLLVAPGAIFELKSVDKLHDRHHSQLLNYLMLCGSRHGKLINVRPEQVEHVFVNTSLTRADRISFTVDESSWKPTDSATTAFPAWMTEAILDWGTCLDRCLYRDAAIHFFGGEQSVVKAVPVCLDGNAVAHQTVCKANMHSALQVTTLNAQQQSDFTPHLHRLLRHTNLAQVHWVNIGQRTLTFRTVSQQT